MKILANDGISASGKALLEQHGFEVTTSTIAQEALAEGINNGGFSALLVRSATKVRKEHIDACPNLKIIGRGGVGMDNIDVAYARERGLKVINTPAASSISVAELAMGGLFSMARFIYDADRRMPSEGAAGFEGLKKSYSKGTELRGKTLGIIGFGGIGQALAGYAIGCGMKVICNTHSDQKDYTIHVTVANQEISVKVANVSQDELLASSHYISIHVPKQPGGAAVLDAAKLAKCRKGVGLVNTSRGGIIDEDALLEALNNGAVGAAFLDVFNGEPAPRADLLAHPRIISMPHVGGSTVEAQDRIGTELAEQIIEFFKK